MGLVRTGWCMSLRCRLGVFVVFSFFLSGCVSVSDVVRVVGSVVGSDVGVKGDSVSLTVPVDVDTVEEECAGLVGSTVGREFIYCMYVNGVAPSEPVVDDSVVELLDEVGEVRVMFSLKVDVWLFPATASKLYPGGGDLFTLTVEEQLEMVQIRAAEKILFDDMWDGFTVEEKSDIMLDVELLQSGFYVATVGKVGLDALMGSEEVFEIVLVPEMLNML